MKLERVPYEPGALIDFYEEGMTALGALCARTWYNRIEVVAEGDAVRLWNTDGALHAVELEFAPAESSGARDAGREIFPGCPLTFRLAEALRPVPLTLERVVLALDGPAARAPDAAVAEKLWRTHHPDTIRWRQTAPFVPDFHFSLVAVVRCEIQATDQHWSLHRVALGLPRGQIDEALAREIGFAQAEKSGHGPTVWPAPDPAAWSAMFGRAMEQELGGELTAVRMRQESRLRRELDRVDDYFENYERELSERAKRGGSAKIKLSDRLAAARAEHVRHRADQVARHEISIVPHIDCLLLVAEPAWRAALQIDRSHQPQTSISALFVPRARRWEDVSGLR
jgi:hypothetical protein